MRLSYKMRILLSVSRLNDIGIDSIPFRHRLVKRIPRLAPSVTLHFTGHLGHGVIGPAPNKSDSVDLQKAH